MLVVVFISAGQSGKDSSNDVQQLGLATNIKSHVVVLTAKSCLLAVVEASLLVLKLYAEPLSVSHDWIFFRLCPST